MALTLLGLLIAGYLAFGAAHPGSGTPGALLSAPTGAVQDRIAADYGNLPLRFEANRGQVEFLSRGPGYSLFLTPSEAVLSLSRGSRGGPGAASGGEAETSAVVRMRLLGANPNPAVEGVDLVYYGSSQRQPEYDFVAAPTG